MGRYLNQVLHQLPADSWESVNLVVAPFTFTRWEEINTILLLDRAAMALRMEQPDLADELTAWLDTVQQASESETFFGYAPIYYGVAVKSTAGAQRDE